MSPERQVFKDLETYVVKNYEVLTEGKTLVRKAIESFFEDHKGIESIEFRDHILWAHDHHTTFSWSNTSNEKLAKCMQILESLLNQLQIPYVTDITNPFFNSI